jgi:hypothetical protein
MSGYRYLVERLPGSSRCKRGADRRGVRAEAAAEQRDIARSVGPDVRAGRCLQAAPVRPVDGAEAAADDDGVRVQQVDQNGDTVPGGVSRLVNDLCRERVRRVPVKDLARASGMPAEGLVTSDYGRS